jgi:hypothetical protein
MLGPLCWRPCRLPSLRGAYLPREVFFGRLGFSGAFFTVWASDFGRFLPATSDSFPIDVLPGAPYRGSRRSWACVGFRLARVYTVAVRADLHILHIRWRRRGAAKWGAAECSARRPQRASAPLIRQGSGRPTAEGHDEEDRRGVESPHGRPYGEDPQVARARQEVLATPGKRRGTPKGTSLNREEGPCPRQALARTPRSS